LQNFSILRATRTVTPGTITSVTQEELAAVVAECAARTERAAASVEESVGRAERVHLNLQVTRLGLEVARLKLEDVIARQQKTMRDY
jgi:hypothetical protein